MGEFPNKSTQFKTGDIRTKEFAKKAGLVKSEKKRIAGLKRFAKQYDITPNVAGRFYQIISDPDFSMFEWYKDIELFERCSKLEPKILPILIDKRRDFHKTVHGDKSSNQINIAAKDSNIMVNIIVPNKDGNKLETKS